MPEFVLDMGTPEAAEKFEALGEFERGYIEAAFWTETGDADDAEQGLEEADFSELAPEALTQMLEDCKNFQDLARESRALDLAYNNTRYTPSQAGHDFWLTRNGHGAGFWDRGLGTVGNQLTDDAKSFGSCDLYRGDDGLIYVM